MDNVKLQLDTNYKKVGNSSGMQVDTLSMAVRGNNFNDIFENNLELLDQYMRYAIDNYDYTADFEATLSKKQAEAYINDWQSYNNDLHEHTEALKEKVYARELDETHPLAIAFDEAENRAENELHDEWLYGDYREAGLLRDASRRYGVDFHYDEKTDTLTVDVDDDQVEQWKEYGDIDRRTKPAIARYLASSIESDAIREHNEAQARREKNRENYETRKRIEAERKAEAEAKRVKRLEAIV